MQGRFCIIVQGQGLKFFIFPPLGVLFSHCEEIYFVLPHYLVYSQDLMVYECRFSVAVLEPLLEGSLVSPLGFQPSLENWVKVLGSSSSRVRAGGGLRQCGMAYREDSSTWLGFNPGPLRLGSSHIPHI